MVRRKHPLRRRPRRIIISIMLPKIARLSRAPWREGPAGDVNTENNTLSPAPAHRASRAGRRPRSTKALGPQPAGEFGAGLGRGVARAAMREWVVNRRRTAGRGTCNLES